MECPHLKASCSLKVSVNLCYVSLSSSIHGIGWLVVSTSIELSVTMVPGKDIPVECVKVLTLLDNFQIHCLQKFGKSTVHRVDVLT